MAFPTTHTQIITSSGDDDGNSDKTFQKTLGELDDVAVGVHGRRQQPGADDAFAGAVADGKSVDGSLGSMSDESRLDLYCRSDIDPVYHAKAHLLNEAFKEIGMGKYQVRRFVA